MVSLPVLEAFLRRHKTIGLDSNLLIYFIEGHPDYYIVAKKIFESIETGRNIGICSTLSLLEVLVQPYRKDDEEMVNEFYSLLATYPHLSWIELSVDIADLGARLRAKYQIKTPDAILLATSIYTGASGFIGNDLRLEKVKELEIFVLA
ncbi:MAG: PIN domain-containing protein [Nitrospirae bacterium]|nr:PIN domain-containing protein [Nitrospirota bacterium]